MYGGERRFGVILLSSSYLYSYRILTEHFVPPYGNYFSINSDLSFLSFVSLFFEKSFYFSILMIG